ncbi:MAG TPA: tetratricopeptide repeat protein [Candidatus Cybelea sp.]|nr:tetratricopeptide repeat protein [Candidatus Cybelea sp.]
MAEPLGELLRSLRSAALLSQEALAERSGLSTRTVSDIETGSARTPRLITVMLLAEAMGLSEPDRARLQDAARRPAASPVGTRPIASSLTLHPAALVGRDHDAEQVGALLLRDDVALLTLVGPAGVGKTSLATRVAVDRVAAFEHGAAVAELAPVAEPSQVPSAVARALGIRESGDTGATEAVAAYLRDRTMLLVLENLEHLTPASAWIGTLLAQSPRLTILATSREPLHLKAERVFAVRPLDKASAVKLFVERAQMVNPEFAVNAGNANAVETIVGHLDGLPLAIELAAPRLLLLPPKALAARLERRLPLLGDGATDRPLRQQTMHGAIAWSYDLLSESEQRLFRGLGVLHGGGTLEAAAAVGSDDRDERSILFRLAPLVEKNMLWLAEDSDAEPRVSMLETLREFANEQLAETGELAEAQRRHAEYMVHFTAGAERELSSSSQARRRAQLERDHANLAAALEWAASNAQAEIGFRLIAELWRFWWLNGYLSEGTGWIRRFLPLRNAAASNVPEVLYCKVLRGHVVLLSALGSFDEARASCEEAIALQRGLGDERGLAASLTSLGVIYQFSGEYDRSEEAHAESLAIRRQIGDEAGIATSLSNLSSVAYSKNDLARAASFGDESVAIYRRLGHESGIAHALTKIGLVAAAEGNYSRAEEIFTECLRMQRAVGNTGSMLYSLVNLGAAAHKRGEYELAMERYHEALELLESTPNKSALAKTLEDIGAAVGALGDPARGARLFGAADALRRTIHSPLFPSDRAEYEAAIASMRGQLGDDAFDVQWRIGSSITLERALEEARQTRVPTAADRNRHVGASHV